MDCVRRRCSGDACLCVGATAAAATVEEMKMQEDERERVLVKALFEIGAFCDFRPAATSPEQIEHLLAAIDCTASMALLKAGAADLAS